MLTLKFAHARAILTRWELFKKISMKVARFEVLPHHQINRFPDVIYDQMNDILGNLQLAFDTHQ